MVGDKPARQMSGEGPPWADGGVAALLLGVAAVHHQPCIDAQGRQGGSGGEPCEPIVGDGLAALDLDRQGLAAGFDQQIDLVGGGGEQV